jgi:hypothetical protein
MNKVDVNKEVFNKAQYIKTIDTNFNELGITSVSEDIDSTISIEKFFDLYNELFYEIEANGGNNTHEFLVKTSGEYINFDQESDMVKALQEEITALRQENLDLQIDVLKAKTGEDIALTSSIDIDINNSKDSQKELFNNLGLNNITGI